MNDDGLINKPKHLVVTTAILLVVVVVTINCNRIADIIILVLFIVIVKN